MLLSSKLAGAALGAAPFACHSKVETKCWRQRRQRLGLNSGSEGAVTSEVEVAADSGFSLFAEEMIAVAEAASAAEVTGQAALGFNLAESKAF